MRRLHEGEMMGGDMIEGNQIQLRPIRDEDWPRLEEWGCSREAL